MQRLLSMPRMTRKTNPATKKATASPKAVRKLAPMQSVFVQEYLIDLNATQAAIRAGYSKKTAEQQGFQLLQKPSVRAAIAERQREREQRTAVTADRVLVEARNLSRHALTLTGDDVDVRPSRRRRGHRSGQGCRFRCGSWSASAGG